MLTDLWLESLEEKDHLEDLGVDGRVVFLWALCKYCGRMRIWFI
jgi:hypothetical protein